MKEVFDDIILNENALVFKVETKITKKRITDLLQYISSDRIDKRHLFREIREEYTVGDKTVLFSSVIFRIRRNPSFIRKESKLNWTEEKYAYLMLVEYDEYCVIIKKNVTGLIKFQRDHLKHIDYEVLAKLFISENTEYRKLTLNNTDPSEYAPRKKIVQSNDVRKNMSPFGTSQYIVGHMKVSDGRKVVGQIG